MKIEARKTMTAPHTHCALEDCPKKLPDAFGYLLWEDHPEDERYCSNECATAQYLIIEEKMAK